MILSVPTFPCPTSTLFPMSRAQSFLKAERKVYPGRGCNTMSKTYAGPRVNLSLCFRKTWPRLRKEFGWVGPTVHRQEDEESKRQGKASRSTFSLFFLWVLLGAFPMLFSSSRNQAKIRHERCVSWAGGEEKSQGTR
jgi:hypothetical protein